MGTYIFSLGYLSMKNQKTALYLSVNDKMNFQRKADELGLSLSSYLRLVLTQTTKP